MGPCHTCGRAYDDSFPDWSICRDCLAKQVPDDSYIDGLGIVWSPDELAAAGGKAEVDRLVRESRV